MQAGNVVLISFFESKESALEGRALIQQKRDRPVGRTAAVVVGREADNTRTQIEVPSASPIGAAVGAAIGAIAGAPAGPAGAAVALLCGLALGHVIDIARTLDRIDLLDEIQDGLEPGQAAIVTFASGPVAAEVERRLSGTDAVTVHRFPRRPIEEDLAREVREATADLERLLWVVPAGDRASGDRDRDIAAARRRLSALEAIADRLLWLERDQFGFEIGILNQELRGSPRWRAARQRRRVEQFRSSHQRTNMLLEASRARVREAQAQG